MLIFLTLLTLYTPWRVEVSCEVVGAAWGFHPAHLKGLAHVESTLQYNPPRYGSKERWGPPPLGRKWNYCGLMQIRGGARPMGQPEGIVFPPCEILILFPELSVWYAALHLDGWRRYCGARRAEDGYNGGCDRCKEDCVERLTPELGEKKAKARCTSFGRKVRRYGKMYRRERERFLDWVTGGLR